MPELDRIESSATPTGYSSRDKRDSFDPSEIGAHCPFDFTPEPHYLSNDTVWVPDEFEDSSGRPRDTSPLSEDARNALMEIDRIFSKADVAPRRIEIEQSWKANHYNRGYQFLLQHRNGGWTLPGNGSPFSSQNQQLLSHMYHTNIYGEKGEIIVAALSREVPRVEFFPVRPGHGPDDSMASVADDLKDIWAKNNNLQAILQDAASIFWTDDRCLFWTRYELNGDEYGYEEEEEPTVPEDELSPPRPRPTLRAASSTSALTPLLRPAERNPAPNPPAPPASRAAALARPPSASSATRSRSTSTISIRWAASRSPRTLTSRSRKPCSRG